MSIMPISNLPDLPKTVSEGNVDTSPLFTTRLQIISGQSKVKVDWNKDKGEPPVDGTIWFGPPGGKDLGIEIIVIPIAVRDHALQMKAGNVSLESFKAPPKIRPPQGIDEEIFRKIENNLKSKTKGIINYTGNDVLFWVIASITYREPIEKFGIFFFRNTAIPEVANCKLNFGKICRLFSDKIVTANFTWYNPYIECLKSPKGEIPNYSIPDEFKLKEELERFWNPTPQGEGREVVDPEGRPR